LRAPRSTALRGLSDENGKTTRQIIFRRKESQAPARTIEIREPHVITVTGNAFYDMAMRLPIIQTGEARRKITRCGKIIR